MPSQWSFDGRTHCQRGHRLAGDNIQVFGNGRRECRLCRRLRERADYLAFEIRETCPHGHRYTKPNTYVNKDGRRRCRACRTRAYELSRCMAHCGRRRVPGQLLCRTHADLCAALDVEYRAYWLAAGYYA